MASAPSSSTLSCSSACARVTSSAEALLCSPYGFGLTTASLLQRGICRLAEGRPLGDAAPIVQEACGTLPASRPGELCILSGIRTAKSMIASALAIRATQACDLAQLAHGEIPRVSIVSLSRDLARVIYTHIRGTLDKHAHLKLLYAREPRADSVMLKHPSGRKVEIAIVAGSKAGGSLVARWSAGVIFDEAARMVGSEDGVVNFDDARKAVLGRMLPGAQVIEISSPWAPYGPIYDMVQAREVCVVKAPGWLMNPVLWTPERCAELKRTEPDVYLTDCAAEFASPEENLFTAVDLERARWTGDTTPLRGVSYYAAMDPATRGNSWTLVIGARIASKMRVLVARQWTGTKLEPLSPRAVLEEIAAICRPYGVSVIDTDQWYGDALTDIGRQYGLVICQRKTSPEDYINIRNRIALGEVEITEPVIPDMRRVKRRLTAAGVRIVLPTTADGRHSDYVPSTILVLSRFLEAERDDSPPTEADRMREAAMKRYGCKSRSTMQW